jgi:signal transduction histidine kinase
VIAIVMRRSDRSLVLGLDLMPESADGEYDMRDPSLATLITDAFDTLKYEGERVIRVVGMPVVDANKWVEITLDENALYQALSTYSSNMLLLSLFVSLMTGALVYFSLSWLIVRPMRRIKDSIIAFRRHPEDMNAHHRAGRRRDEIGIMGRELARMQTDLRLSLLHRNRLAHLGEAMSKVNHDMRNILTTAQLACEVIVDKADDPSVEKSTKRLVNAMKRAVDLCDSTLNYSHEDDVVLRKETIKLHEMIEDVGESLGINSGTFTFENMVDPAFIIFADSSQIYRVFLNLARNAMEAQGYDGTLRIEATRDRKGLGHIHFIDHGDGLPEKALENLFKPFLGGARSGGTGLGLAICKELVVAHNGMISLKKSDEHGSVFIVCLPKK